MAKKSAPAKSKVKPSAKKAASVKPMKKVAVKAKAPVKSGAKKDVKPSAMKKTEVKAAVVKTTAAKSLKNVPALKGKAAAPAKAVPAPVVKGAKGKAVTLNVKAAAAPAPVAKPLRKPLTKAPKGKKAPRVAAPKNYESMCREIACESHHTTSGYCRLHYIKNWKKIKRKELILREKKLNQYIEELVSKYPDKYIEAIKNDLTDENAFSKVIYDLELDENVDDIPSEDDTDEAVIENIKGGFDDSDSDF